MEVRKVIRRRIRREEDGVQIAGDVHVAIAANLRRTGGRASVSSADAGDTPEQRDVSDERDPTPGHGAGDRPASSHEEGGPSDG